MNGRDDLKAIYTAAIDSVNPERAVLDHLKKEGDTLVLLVDGQPIREYPLNDYEKIFVVGGGKATAPMAKAVEAIIGNSITGGAICVKYGYTVDLTQIETIEASHPVPDENGIKGSEEILSILKEAGEKDLVISLISGGGSALLPLPPSPITLNEKRDTTDLLLKSGAAIHEINAVRKHLSLVKGGNLARAAYPATVINLMISDVVGDNMDVIASGPFVPDNSTFSDARDILTSYGLWEKVPKSVSQYIEGGYNGEVEDNLKSDSPVFERVQNLIIASNIIALKAARGEAVKRGYNSLILSSLIEGDTAQAAQWHSRIAREIIISGNPVERPACIISGGETTVEVTGDGMGGRNMEFALRSALLIEGRKGVIMASIGTDGSDGPTDAAGALADGRTVENAERKGINIRDYVANNDSYHFFEKIDDLIKTGPTNTNVMDVRIILVE